MDDARVRAFETALWIGGEDVYRRSIDPECVMVLPEPPYAMRGEEAIGAVAATPHWSDVALEELTISRPTEALIAIAYRADASREGERYTAWCTSTYRRVGHEEWQVVQHQQSIAPPLAAQAGGIEQAQEQAAQDRESEGGYQ